MKVSINELAELTGKDRRTITSRLEAADLPWDLGEKSAHLYDSRAALEALYVVDSKTKSLDQAKTEKEQELALLTRVRREELQKQRWPAAMVLAVLEVVTQAAAATLKAAKGKNLSPDKINQILEGLRAAPAKLR